MERGGRKHSVSNAAILLQKLSVFAKWNPKTSVKSNDALMQLKLPYGTVWAGVLYIIKVWVEKKNGRRLLTSLTFLKKRLVVAVVQ